MRERCAAVQRRAPFKPKLGRPGSASKPRQDLVDRLRAHRLDQVKVEAGAARAPPVVFAAPTGECHQHASTHGAGRRAGAQRLRGRPCRPCRCRRTPPRVESRALPAVPRRRCIRCASGDRSPRAGSPMHRRRRRCRRPPAHGCAVAAGAWPSRSKSFGDTVPVGLDGRQAHGELAARAPRPRYRALTLPPCKSTSRRTSDRPMPSPSGARSTQTPDLREHVEHLREHVGGMPVPLSTHPRDRLAALALQRDSDAATLGRVLGGVVQQVANHLRQTRRVAVDPDRLIRQVDTQLVLRRIDERLACPRAPHRSRRAGRHARAAARPCRCVMRDTSSRSSISRTSCSTWRSIMRQHARGLLARRSARASAPARRCGSAPADCAARAPAWRGTRPCGGRRRARPARRASAR